MGRAERIQSVADAKALARRRLPKSLFQAIEGGSGTASTQRANAAAVERVRLAPKAGISIAAPDLAVRVAGQKLAAPLVLAPTGNLRFYHRDGEAGVARAAGSRGVAMTVGTLAGTAIEAVAPQTAVPPFYQLYPLGDRDLALFALERAQAAGCRVLVLTLDAAAHIPRERAFAERAFPVFMAGSSLANALRFAPQALAAPGWTLDLLRDRSIMDAPMARSRPASPREQGCPMGFLEAFHRAASPHVPFLTWEDFGWIRKAWHGPILAKGILRPDDARRAVGEGAAGVIVSNHGGMVCDGAPGTFEALPAIVAAVGAEAEVLVDGGVRRGLDVLKALALGARAVMLGHAYVWPLAAAGEAGVARMLDLFLQEMAEGMRYLGCETLADLGPDALFPA